MLLLALLLLPAAFSQDFTVDSSIAIPMRDGTALATDIYFPAVNGARKPGKFPVILSRTPYNKASSEGRMYAAKGYVFVNQDTRGRYASEGKWDFLNIDVNDGYDTAAWIVKQPWSSGKIGTIGTSYVGGTQHAIALSARARGGCLGVQRRRKTWEPAISPGESVTGL